MERVQQSSMPCRSFKHQSPMKVEKKVESLVGEAIAIYPPFLLVQKCTMIHQDTVSKHSASAGYA